jgi:MFS family permease
MICADFLPALLAPLAGVLADRIELRRLMVICELGQALITAVMVVSLNVVPVLLGLVFLRAVLGQIFQPASRAGVPEMVDDEHLPAANAALGFGEHGLSLLGPVLAAVLIPVVHVSGVLMADAATFLGSAALLIGLPRMPARSLRLESGVGAVLGQAGRGIRYLLRTRGLRVVVVSFALVVAFNGVDDVALVFLATGPLGASDSAAGLLYAGTAAGLLIGFALVSRTSRLVAAPALMVAGYALSSLGNLLTGLAGAVATALLLQAIRGIGLAGMDVGATTVIQRTVPPAMQGRTFGNFYGAIGIAAGSSYLLGGVLLNAVGPRLTFVIVGAGGLLTAAVTAFFFRMGRTDRPP